LVDPLWPSKCIAEDCCDGSCVGIVTEEAELMPYHLKCGYCDRQFTTKDHRRKHCSHRCAGLRRSAERKAQQEPGGTGRTPLGALILRTREARGLSQPALAQRSGVARHNIYAVEAGKTKEPAATMLVNLARALDIDMRTMFAAAAAVNCEAASADATPDYEIAAYLRRRRLSDESVHTILRLIRLFEIGDRFSSSGRATATASPVDRV
jgi:transcriptional regulator with XRE-family HTH domain